MQLLRAPWHFNARHELRDEPGPAEVGMHAVHVILVLPGSHIVVSGHMVIFGAVVHVQLKPGQVLWVGASVELHLARLSPGSAGLKGVQHLLRQCAHLESTLESRSS